MKNQHYRLYAMIIAAGMILASCGTKKANGADKDNDKSDTAVSETHAKPDNNKVPKLVIQRFEEDYPGTTYYNWSGYPSADDWYGSYDDNLPDSEASSYIVQFAKDSIPYKAVYSKAGDRIASHKSISVLPDAISWALSNGDYKTWTIGKEKEEIFKDKDSDKLKVYMVTVEKDGHKHILYFQSDRRLMKDKTIS